MKQLTLILCLLFAISCGKESKSTQTIDTIPLNTAWAPTALPIVFLVSLELQMSRPNLTAAIESAADSWNDALGREIIKIQYMNSIPNYNQCDPFARDNFKTILLKSDWTTTDCRKTPSSPSNFLNAQTLAITLFATQDNRLVHADILFNDQNFNFETEPIGSQIDLQSVVVHEMGHALGLKHICKTQTEDDNNPSYGCVGVESGSVMNPTIESAQRKRNLSTGDVDRINSLY